MWQIWIYIDKWFLWGEYDAKWKAELILDMMDITYPKRSKRIEYIN